LLWRPAGIYLVFPGLALLRMRYPSS
jgi:hypothetical protein